MKCIEKASQVASWPDMTKGIRENVKGYGKCETHRKISREPVQQMPFPERAWWRVAIDLFELDNKNYYSRFIAVYELTEDTTSRAEIKKTKTILYVENLQYNRL